MQNFNNNRPITITCMLYRALEMIILKKMQDEEKESGRNIKGNNINQIGFSKGKGCEINLLKL